MLADIEKRFDRKLPPNFADTLRTRTAAVFGTELKAIAGIEDVLNGLTCRTCVASSSDPRRIEHSLTLVGLFRYFHPHIFSATQVPRGKPAPDLFLHAARQMEIAPQSCIVIEDSLLGVQAGVDAGMRVIGFAGGSHCLPGHRKRLRAAGASADCSRMDELLTILKNVEG